MSATDAVLTCPTCGPAWDGRYDTDHRCETCRSILLAREGRDECERLRAERDALSAHVEWLEGLRRQVIAAIRDDSFELMDPTFFRDDKQPPKPAASLARRDAEQQKIGAASFRQEVMESVKMPFRPHIQGVFDVWLRRQAEQADQ